MPLEGLLDLIRKQFSPAQGQMLVSSLQQDPLVWQFAQEEEKSLSYFQSNTSDILAFSPGRITSWLFGDSVNQNIGNLQEIDFQLPEEIKQRASQALETISNTGLPPSDLKSAGLLAISIRERRSQNGDWQGLSAEIFEKSKQLDIQKFFRIWRTPFACLFSYCADFNDLIEDFLNSEKTFFAEAAVPLTIHAYLSNPIDDEKLQNHLYQLFVNRTQDLQLDSLKWLEAFQRFDLRKKLAQSLLETKKNIDFSAGIYSELEVFKTFNQDIDPLEKQIRYTLPEDLNRLGAFYYYSGNKQKAAETYQISSDLLKFLESQTLFQAIKNQKGQPSPASWMGLMSSLPNSKTIKHYFIDTLINEEKLSEAEEKLEFLADSFEKEILKNKIEHIRGDEKPLAAKSFETKRIRKTLNFPAYYVYPAQFDNVNHLLEIIESHKDVQAGIKLTDEILQNNFQSLNIVRKIRDIYEKSQNFDKALALTSYLERREPKENDHKRSLARLYSKNDRWEETYTTSQAFIKSTSTPEMEDLEIFAESALKTNRIDIAISVSQNILKKDAHNTKALILLGESFMHKGDIIKAIQHMEQVVEMIPDEPETWLTLARLWEENGQKDRSFEILNKGVLALPSEPKLLRSFGKSLLERKSPSEALSYLEKAYEIDPENLKGKLDLADAKYQMGHFDAAWKLLEPFEETYPQYPIVSKLMGKVMLDMGKQKAAEPVLIFASEQYPEDIDIVLTTARLIINRYENSFEELPGENLENLSAILNKALDITPSQKVLKLHQADVERLSGNLLNAMESYKALSEELSNEKSPINWRLNYGLGKTSIALGEYDMGLAALQDAGSEQPENLLIIHALVEAYQSANLQTKAEALAKTALKLAPQDISNILWYANHKNQNNKPEEAIKALKEALHINPDKPQLKLWLAKIHISTGDHEDAKTILSDLINHDDTTPDQLFQAAYICVRMNQLELAVDAFEKTIGKSKTFNLMTVLNLAAAYALIDQEKKALELLNVTQESHDNFPHLYLMKSDILTHLGQYQLALNTLKSIEEIAKDALTDNDVINNNKDISPLLYTYDFTFTGYLYRLGQLNRALGDFKSAMAYLTHAVELNPNEERLEHAIIETRLQLFDFDEITKETHEDQKEAFGTDALGVDQLDSICSKAEILILQGNPEKAAEIINKMSPANRTYPRYLALQSRLASFHGDVKVAEDYLKDAVNAYQNTLDGMQSKTLQILFRKLRNLISIAGAALALDDDIFAIQTHEQAWHLLDNQPFNNWRFAKTLIKSAEDQQKARVLSITNHSPGEAILSDNYQNLAQNILNNLKKHLPEEAFICCQGRMAAAFSGEWPLGLNADVCLNTPETAASVVISTHDDKLVEQIMDAYPQNAILLQAYGIYALKNNKRKGLQYAAKALEFDTSNPVNHALLAMLNKDHPEQALKSIETALTFWPDESKWHAYTADLYKQIEKHDMATRHIAEALKNQPENADFWRMSAEINLELNNLRHAKHDLERSASLSANDTEIWVKMADVNRRMGFVHEATQNIETASKLSPKDETIAIKEAGFLYDTKQFEQAEVKAKEIINNQGNNIDAYIILAQAQAKQGKFIQALATLDKANQMNPANKDIDLEILKIRKDQEGIETILPNLIALAQKNPENPTILTTLTDWLIKTNRLNQAKETAQTILKIMPNQAEVHLMLGRLQRLDGQLDQALAHFADAITLEPNNVDAYIEMGKTYRDRRDLENAIETFQKGTQADASDPRPYYHAGMALKECKDYTSAEAMLKQAKKYSPDDPNVVRQLGMVTALNLIDNLREAS